MGRHGKHSNHGHGHHGHGDWAVHRDQMMDAQLRVKDAMAQQKAHNTVGEPLDVGGPAQPEEEMGFTNPVIRPEDIKPLKKKIYDSKRAAEGRGIAEPADSRAEMVTGRREDGERAR